MSELPTQAMNINHRFSGTHSCGYPNSTTISLAIGLAAVAILVF
jgi:hypothetical protein